MNNFMIGMHGKYDFCKFDRDFKKEFYGLEICLFNEEDVKNLIKESKKNHYKYGIHFPLIKNDNYLRDVSFLSLDHKVRTESYKRIEDELKYIKENKLNPEYILFHFPKPAIIDRNFDLTRWRFSDRSEYVYEDEYPIERFKLYSEELFKWLTLKSEEYNFIPVLELDALNKYIFNDNFIDNLFKKYKNIRLCLDTGRLHIQNMINDNFDAYALVSRFARYTYLVHLWNAKAGDTKYYHYPPLKKLKSEEGFADIEKYLKLIKNTNSNFKILFEHKSEVISYKELQECYEYIKTIIN